MGKKKKKEQYVVYSTNPDFSFDGHNEEATDTLPAQDQNLRVLHDRKQRRGKTVTLVTGFQGTEDDMKDLCKYLKSQCGSGGSVKDGELVIQGAFKEKICDLLIKKGYTRTKTAGG